MLRGDHPEAEKIADLVDVQILDITAHIEALLRGVREVQHAILNVRGAGREPVPPGGRIAAAELAATRLAAMQRDCDSLKEVIGAAIAGAAALRTVAEQE
jgi:hypothetical protein